MNNITQTERTCPTCGKTFMRVPSRPGNYCERQCWNTRPHTRTTQRTCPQCGKVFMRELNHKGDYCTQSCAGHAKAKPVAGRLWSKVDRSGGANACWLWTGWVHESTGYAKLTIKNRGTYAHRIAWEVTNGPIPDGMLVCHNCPDGDNPLCCNPAHLWLGTHAENSADMVRKGRAATGDRNGTRRRKP